MKETIYLAGGISGLSYEEATSWRKEAYNILSPRYKILDPMREKELLTGVSEIAFDYEDIDETLSAHEIFNRDVGDLDESDIIFARLDTAKSVGTPWEVGYAYAKNKEIVLVVPKNLKGHPFVLGTTNAIFTDWKAALNIYFN